MVSQDPLLLSNETLRFNLDPDGTIPDDLIIDAISKAGLWTHFSAGHTPYETDTDITPEPGTPGHAILDQKISNFQGMSVGQCQLFALCRGFVKVNSLRRSGVKPVILLDEITSSLDISTELMIHRMIDEEFTGKGHTVIIVAHRLGALKEHTKPGRDAIALMADGRLQEHIKELKPDTFEYLGKIG